MMKTAAEERLHHCCSTRTAKPQTRMFILLTITLVGEPCQQPQCQRIKQVLCGLLDASHSTPNLHSESGAITTQIALHCCIGWSSGGNHNDICLLVGCSTATFCVHAHRCIKAINEAFQLHCPTPPHETEQAAKVLQSGSHRLIEGCGGCFVGWNVDQDQNSLKQRGHVKAFFLASPHMWNESPSCM